MFGFPVPPRPLGSRNLARPTFDQLHGAQLKGVAVLLGEDVDGAAGLGQWVQVELQARGGDSGTKFATQQTELVPIWRRGYAPLWPFPLGQLQAPGRFGPTAGAARPDGWRWSGHPSSGRAEGPTPSPL